MIINWKSILVFVPILMVIVEILDNFTNDMSSLFRAFFLFLIIIIFFFSDNKIKYDLVFKSMIIFLIYTFFISFFSSDYAITFSSYLSILTSMIFYLISYNKFVEKEDLRYLRPLLIIIPVLFLINLVVYTGLNVGEAVYGGVLRFGDLHDNVIYVGSLIVLLSLVFKKFSKNYTRDLIFISILFIILLLSFRRTAIILVIAGFLVYMFMSNKKQAIKRISILAILVAISYPLYDDYLSLIIEARGQRATFEIGIEQESRYREMELISLKSYSFEDIEYSLFGVEYLNSVGTYSTSGIAMRSERPLHTDYALVLHGSGIIGLILYSFLLFAVVWKSIKAIKILGFKDEVSIMLMLLSVVLILVTFSGSILSIGFRTTYFILLGLFMRIADESIEQ